MSDQEIFRRLMEPFGPNEVKTRSESGRSLSYITARTAMNRLDEVVGPANWSNRFYEACGCLACEITITLPSGKVVSKSDGGGFKEMVTKSKGQVVKDEENTDKTGFSDAFKRACIMFGIGRYLYRDGVADLSEVAAEPPPSAATPRRTDERTYREFVLAGIESANRQIRTDAAKCGVELHDSHLVGLAVFEKHLHGWCATKQLVAKPTGEVSPELREHLLTKAYATHRKEVRNRIREMLDNAVADRTRKFEALSGKGDAYEEALSN